MPAKAGIRQKALEKMEPAMEDATHRRNESELE